jgi:thiol-disulfide isomerase/thioredoxin
MMTPGLPGRARPEIGNSPERDRAPRRWLRRLAWPAAIAVLALVWVQLGRGLRVVPARDASPASALELVGLDGGRVTLAEQRGKVVLLNLWASWCAPCRAEVPGLNRLSHRLADDGLVVLGINVDSASPPQVAELAERLGVDYPVFQAARDLDGTFAGADVIPHTWLIDREGRLRASHAGYASERSLRRACERLLAERE